MTEEAGHWRKATTFVESCQHAWRGLWRAFYGERNFRIQLIVFLVAVVLGVVLRLTVVEIAVVLVMAALVLSLELVNTALEMLADVVQPAYHDKIGLLKDVTAAAVLISSGSAVLVGVLVYGSALLRLGAG